MNKPALKPLAIPVKQPPRVYKPPFASNVMVERSENIPGFVVRGDTVEDILVHLNNLVVNFGSKVLNDRHELRYEVANVTAIIENPSSSIEFENYNQSLLDPGLPPDVNYTYGNRLMYSIEDTVNSINSNEYTRKAHHSLWNNWTDGVNSSPCLVSITVMVRNGKLRMTAIFRTHNLNMAYERNVSGLSYLMEEISEKTGIRVGELVITSISLTSQVPLKLIPVKDYPRDPAGDLVVTRKGDSLNCFGERGSYQAQKASELLQEVFTNGGISTIPLVIYVLKELGL